MLKIQKNLLLVLLLFLVNATKAQDIIYLKTGEEILAKVIEINPTDIQYRKYNDKDGPLYTRNKSEVFMIKYPNGTKDVFNQIGSTVERSNLSIDPSHRELKAGTQINVMLVNE